MTKLYPIERHGCVEIYSHKDTELIKNYMERIDAIFDNQPLPSDVSDQLTNQLFKDKRLSLTNNSFNLEHARKMAKEKEEEKRKQRERQQVAKLKADDSADIDYN